MSKKLLSIFFIFLSSISVSAKDLNTDISATEAFRSYLSIKTWSNDERYNAAHFLLVPMYYIYENKELELIKELDKHVDSFLNEESLNINYKESGSKLTYLQYYYFLSEYLVLSNNQNKKLSNFLLSQINLFWEGDVFIENAKKRANRQLNSNDHEYRQGLIDEDLFIFGISANLLKFFPKNNNLNRINLNALSFLQQRSSFTSEGGWLFEKGYWDDYPDRAYAGYNSKINVSNKKPLKDMVSDSSHFQRWPKILLSIQNAYTKNSSEYFLLKKYRSGLKKQFLSKVIHINNNKIQLTNYMDGRNGLYRWNYHTLGKGKGYGPYELTSSFGIGWWVFLGGNNIKKIYYDYYEQININDKDCDTLFKKIILIKKINNRNKFNECFFIYNSFLASKLTLSDI